ncbi:hypothetical protein BDE40_3535 [Litoreibacter halocynthiae]|uniref:Uncharacterized protein n=1 Tax=Litoreibacter halocynthiae TaxID=1242689 RepID=A0A4R7LB48_9RHOB|nr:hypothetical protein BDE40_3535 [Litoreibacter halocynthiae]
MRHDLCDADMNKGSISLSGAVGMGTGVMIWTRSLASKNQNFLRACHCFTPHCGAGT